MLSQRATDDPSAKPTVRPKRPRADGTLRVRMICLKASACGKQHCHPLLRRRIAPEGNDEHRG